MNSNPILNLLERAAEGNLPSDDELDQPKLGPTARRELAEAATVVAGIASGGESDDARSRARSSAERITAIAETETQTFNDLIRGTSKKATDRTPQELAADAIEAASNATSFNDLIRQPKRGKS